MSKRKCGKCGKSGHNARTCKLKKVYREKKKKPTVTKEMIDIINEAMSLKGFNHPTIFEIAPGEIAIASAPHITGLLALSFCRVYLNLPQKDCPGPPPGTLAPF